MCRVFVCAALVTTFTDIILARRQKRLATLSLLVVSDSFDKMSNYTDIRYYRIIDEERCSNLSDTSPANLFEMLQFVV